MQVLSKNLKFTFLFLFLVSLAFVFLFSFLGHPVISFSDLFSVTHNTDYFVFYHLRLPRVILAFLVGASLSVAGVSFQSLLKNPLADPYILGISGGAALGYVLAVVLGLPFFFHPLCGFLFALLSLLIIYRLACQNGVLSVLNLLLIGIVFNAFSFALILVINSLVPFGQTQQILYLLLGSLDPLSWSKLLVFSGFVILATVILFFQSNKLNILSLGEEEAFHLGVNVNRERKILFVVTSLLVGASVSLCGLIGFVGLIIPHLTRILFGADNRVVLPASALFGGMLLIVCDFLAGNIFSFEFLSTKLPVGAVTALMGAPIFVWLLKKYART